MRTIISRFRLSAFVFSTLALSASLPAQTKIGVEGAGAPINGTKIELYNGLGVRCAVIHDVVTKDNGEVIEDTTDWYAQDTQGNVWYFGEVALNLVNGVVHNLHGSWMAGVDGALPGIIMKAVPVVGTMYRQEFSLGTAEDLAEVVSVTGSATAAGAKCAGNCLGTRDFTPVEPGVNVFKYYAPGVGVMVEDNKDTKVRKELVEIKN